MYSGSFIVRRASHLRARDWDVDVHTTEAVALVVGIMLRDFLQSRCPGSCKEKNEAVRIAHRFSRREDTLHVALLRAMGAGSAVVLGNAYDR
jgi:hypothetical protein